MKQYLMHFMLAEEALHRMNKADNACWRAIYRTRAEVYFAMADAEMDAFMATTEFFSNDEFLKWVRA